MMMVLMVLKGRGRKTDTGCKSNLRALLFVCVSRALSSPVNVQCSVVSTSQKKPKQNMERIKEPEQRGPTVAGYSYSKTNRGAFDSQLLGCFYFQHDSPTFQLEMNFNEWWAFCCFCLEHCSFVGIREWELGLWGVVAKKEMNVGNKFELFPHLSDWFRSAAEGYLLVING